MSKMKLIVLVSFCTFNVLTTLATNTRDSKKLFGGYRITPKFCKTTRTPNVSLGGPNICMFNHECILRQGQVVGACMDGFLFGACCQLPDGAAGELMESDLLSTQNQNNLIFTKPPYPTPGSPGTTIDITSSGVSQIAESLLNPNKNNYIHTQNNPDIFTSTGITHSGEPETVLLNNGGFNSIAPEDFKPSTPSYATEELKTTVRNDGSNEFTPGLPLIHISISGLPEKYTPTPGFQKPMFRPRPPTKPSDGDKYVLVPTISHTVNPNKTQATDSAVNIADMLDETSPSSQNPYYPSSTNSYAYVTTKKPPSTSYVFSSLPTKRPGLNSQKQSTKKPPSTSYVFSSTFPSTTKKKPPKTTTTKYTYPPSTTQYPYTYYRPGHSTLAYSPDAFSSTNRPTYGSTPTRRPPLSSVTSHISGPTFSVSSSPGQFSSYPSPAPTLIVLAPAEEVSSGSDYSTRRPAIENEPPQPNRKPVAQLTINNHIIQNIYSTQRPPQSTIVITPKPGISNSVKKPTTEYENPSLDQQTSSDNLINFPPVRNPNLNISAVILDENDITTPTFIEDQVLDQKVESFVNTIIQGLQDPFQDLKDVVYNKNKTNVSQTTTTRKPVKAQGTSTKKPATRPVTSNAKPTTRRPTSNKPGASTSVTKKPTTKPTKRTKPTKKGTTPTTTESFIEAEDADNANYRNQCGIRPLMKTKTGRIVGGKGATFGEFPWQVLIRELTWFGLFTKNKCGGVLISNKYVMTAAHCQPGILASLVAVFGELDISGDRESKKPISRNVKRVIVHRKYDPSTFENDLALLELEHPIQFDTHIVPICLPRDDEDFTGRMATVTGWGRLMYGGGVPSVLQEVQVPIMENQVCQEMFRTAGHSKIIIESFLCAGYANGQKDSCEGDSGGPLVLQRPDGRYQLAGTVSHGIKCAAPYLPGVYMRTTYYKPWITSITGLT